MFMKSNVGPQTIIVNTDVIEIVWGTFITYASFLSHICLFLIGAIQNIHVAATNFQQLKHFYHSDEYL